MRRDRDGAIALEQKRPIRLDAHPGDTARIQAEQGRVDCAGKRLTRAQDFKRRQDLERIAIEKGPWHVRKCTPEQWQQQNMPAVELDEHIAFRRMTLAAERRNDTAYP